MATVDTSVNELVINKLTQAQYDALTEKSPTELYFVTDAQDDSSPIQVEVMPEASADYAGKIIQYIGETNAEYTRGFFYEFGEKFIMPTVREFDVSVSTPTGDAAVEVEDQEKFFKFVTQTVMDNGYLGLVTTPTHVNIMLDPAYVDGDKYPVTIIAGEGEIEMQAFFTLEYLQQNTGISGLNDSDEYMIVDIMFNLTTPGSLTEGWKRVDVQPSYAFTAGTGIDIINNKINVQTPVYKTVNPYFDSDGVDLIGLRIGRGPLYHEHFDRGAIILGGTEMSPSREIGGSVVIGGKAAVEFGGSVAIGSHARAIGDVSTAIGGGRNCAATGDGAIQLGYNGVNPDNNTFKVATLSGNFEMMSADGTIPTDRYTTTPTDAGTYVPKLTIAEDGTATREWGTESGGAGGSSPQVTELPDASLNIDKVVQYVGESTDTLTNGYFYKAEQPDPLTAEITNFDDYGFSTASVEVGDFNLFVEKFGDAYGTYVLKTDDMFGWSLQKPDGTSSGLAPISYGINITIDGELQTTADSPLAAASGNLEITIVYTASGGFVWKNIEVQKVDIKKQLPSLSSGADKFLMTDGVDLYWEYAITPSSYAMKSMAGIIRPSSTYGTTMASVQYLAAEVKTPAQYEAANNQMFVSKGTLDNVLESYMLAPVPPTDNGTYVLKATVVDGVVTTEWVSEA